MTTIQLDDQVAAALTSQAEAKGLSLADYLAQLADMHAPLPNYAPLPAKEFIRRLEELSTSGAKIEGTFTRAEIYRDHD